MGLLSKGTPLSWEQSRRYHSYIKHHGIIQFINIYREMASRENEVFLWGDEVEHMLIEVDPINNTAKVACRAPEILEQLERMDEENNTTTGTNAQPPHSTNSPSSSSSSSSSPGVWHAHFVPEYGRYMIEATPSRPYGGYTADLRMVEPNMRLRRKMVQTLLKPNEMIMTLTSFPLLGVGDYCNPYHHPYGPIARSLYITDAIIGPHPRFATLTRNIRIRRGSKVCIRVPLYQDAHTAEHMKAQLQLREQILKQHHQQQQQQRERIYGGHDHHHHHGEEENKEEPESPDQNSIVAHLTASAAIPPLITSATNLSDDGDELYPPIPDNTCVPPINEMEEIHMDAMAFGMGNCCLQVTFNTRSIGEARHLYDHLAVLSPIMLALTAATPFYRGRISDIDVRWTVISQSVDDRTNKERGLEDLDAIEMLRKASIADYDDDSNDNERPHHPDALSPTSSQTPSTTSGSSSSSSSHNRPQRLYKSRYDSISTYLSLEKDFKPVYNDIPCERDQESYDTLIHAGIDPLLAHHISHLFVRDPLVIYDESVILDDLKSSEHFENIQSTNWQTVRFKPPPPPFSAGLGWRVEFRTMEVQLTDFENAAFTVFVALISRAILYFSLNFYLPLSKVDENLQRAHTRDAVNGTKFYWRKIIKSCPDDQTDCGGNKQAAQQAEMSAAGQCNIFDIIALEYEEMSMKDIMLGKPSTDYPGLIPIVRAYLAAIKCDAHTLSVVDQYLTLLSMRASGQLLTAASWLRRYVEVHPHYQHNSQLTQPIVSDMIRTIHQIQSGQIEVTQLLGKLRQAYTDSPLHKTSNGLHHDDSQGQLNEPNNGGDNDDDVGVELMSTPKLLDLNDPHSCAKFRSFLCQQAKQQQEVQSRLIEAQMRQQSTSPY